MRRRTALQEQLIASSICHMNEGYQALAITADWALVRAVTSTHVLLGGSTVLPGLKIVSASVAWRQWYSAALRVYANMEAFDLATEELLLAVSSSMRAAETIWEHSQLNERSHESRHAI